MARTLDPLQTGAKAFELEYSLRQKLVGQDDAIRQIVSAYQMYLTGMNAPARPVANFLFLGPTGSGKTKAVEATAEALTGKSENVIKIDCAEFHQSQEIGKITGSPPGYIGHRETVPLLSQERLTACHGDHVKLSFVLFDEIEKACDALWNLLLGILDKAILTTGENKRVDFTQSLIFMTSNLGAEQMSRILSPSLGFGTLTGSGAPAGKLARASTEAVRRKFRPEFVNRLDKIVVFQPLGEGQLREILDLELHYVQERIFHARNGVCQFVFNVSDGAKERLLAAGVDSRYGARHLKRAVERMLVQPMANLIATGQVRRGDVLRVDHDAAADALRFERESENEPVRQIAIAGAASRHRAATAQFR